MAEGFLDQWGTNFYELWLLLFTFIFSFCLFLSFLSLSLSPSSSPLLLPSFLRSLFNFLNFCLYVFFCLWWTSVCMIFVMKLKASKVTEFLFWKSFQNPFHELVYKDTATCLGCTINLLFVFTDMNVCVC